jgi:hypothetical protein
MLLGDCNANSMLNNANNNAKAPRADEALQPWKVALQEGNSESKPPMLCG